MPNTYDAMPRARNRHVLPADGDLRNAASVNAPLQSLADAHAHVAALPFINWTVLHLGAETDDFSGIAAGTVMFDYNGNPLLLPAEHYLAVGEGPMVYVSYDGQRWVRTAHAGSHFGGVDLVVVSCDVSTSTWVTAGPISGTVQLFSTDNPSGAWTARTNPVSGGGVRGLANNNAGVFVAVGGSIGSQSLLLRSADGGVTWVQQLNPTNLTLRNITFGNGLFVVVGGSLSGTPWIMTSLDGVTWTPRSSPVDATLHNVVWDGTWFVIFGSNGTVLTSSDGVGWVARTPLVHSSSGFVAAAADPAGIILAARDPLYFSMNGGVSFTKFGQLSEADSIDRFITNACAYGHGRFILAGDRGHIGFSLRR